MVRLKQDNTKLGIKNKRLKAAWDEGYLTTLGFDAPDSRTHAPASDPPNMS